MCTLFVMANLSILDCIWNELQARIGRLSCDPVVTTSECRCSQGQRCWVLWTVIRCGCELSDVRTGN